MSRTIQSRSSRHRKRKRTNLLITFVIACICLAGAAAGWEKLLSQKNRQAQPANSQNDRRLSEHYVQDGRDKSKMANKSDDAGFQGNANSDESDNSDNSSGNSGNVIRNRTDQGATNAGPLNNGDSKPVTGDDALTFTFIGDVMFAGKVTPIMDKYGYDYPYVEVKDKLTDADITIANLETPITEGGTPQDKEYVYKSSPKALKPLMDAGIDVVNLANNHSMDQGQQGLLDTFKHLKENGLPYVGAGNDAAEAFKPVIIEKKGKKIAILGFSHVVPDGSWKAGPDHPGVADSYDYRLPVKAVEDAKKQADFVIAVNHWGVERKATPEDYQRELAHRLIDAGADLIVGSHVHVLQGFEQYNGKWIAYGLGNFIFTTNSNSETWNTAILHAACTMDAGCALKVDPVLSKYAQPVFMNPESSQALFKKLSGISIGAVVGADGNVAVK